MNRFCGTLGGVAFCCLFAVSAVAIPPWRALAADVEQTDADRSALAAQATKVSEILWDARRGHAISQVRLGWFVAGLLGELCAQDPELALYVHRNDLFVESYLINTFQYHSAEEVAAVAAMAGVGRSPLRLAARWGLESLRHIPNSDDPEAVREQDRQELVAALVALDGLLRTLAVAVASQGAR